MPLSVNRLTCNVVHVHAVVTFSKDFSSNLLAKTLLAMFFPVAVLSMDGHLDCALQGPLGPRCYPTVSDDSFEGSMIQMLGVPSPESEVMWRRLCGENGKQCPALYRLLHEKLMLLVREYGITTSVVFGAVFAQNQKVFQMFCQFGVCQMREVHPRWQFQMFQSLSTAVFAAAF